MTAETSDAQPHPIGFFLSLQRTATKNLVLGARGCGAFGCDGDMISNLFADALHDTYSGGFRRVEFAITDWSDERKFIGPFARAFDQPVS